MKKEQLFDVKGLATVVTGAAHGIGLAYAEVMADNGANVTLMDINATRLRDSAGRLRTQCPDSDIREVVVDITDKGAVQSAFEATAKHYGRLDVVFANAGIHGGPAPLTIDGKRDPEGALENLSEETWNRLIDINLTGVLTTMQAAVPHMKSQGTGGRIIVTTSLAGLGPTAVVGTPYVVTKTAVAGLVRQAALELAKYSILVNGIAPGAFDTDMMKPDFAQLIKHVTPMHRIASTEEIQGLALFLASPASRYVTGAQMVIDGGSSLGMAD